MSTGLTTLWRHQPCGTLFSFGTDDRPDLDGDDCDVCEVSMNTEWAYEKRQYQGRDLTEEEEARFA